MLRYTVSSHAEKQRRRRTPRGTATKQHVIHVGSSTRRGEPKASRVDRAGDGNEGRDARPQAQRATLYPRASQPEESESHVLPSPQSSETRSARLPTARVIFGTASPEAISVITQSHAGTRGPQEDLSDGDTQQRNTTRT